MIAKATPKGKSFHGIINYIFYGRKEDRGNAQKSLKLLPILIMLKFLLGQKISKELKE
jgi:hypothetical protein